MNEKSKAILAGFTGRKKRSQLTPHCDLICKLHQRGCTFREIVRILSDNFNLPVAPSTVFRFIARLEQEASNPQKIKTPKEKPIPTMPPVTRNYAPMPSTTMPSDEIRQRIAAFKQQVAQPEPGAKRFEYNPDKSLHLISKDEKSC